MIEWSAVEAWRNSPVRIEADRRVRRENGRAPSIAGTPLMTKSEENHGVAARAGAKAESTDLRVGGNLASSR
jgi:hypothetical protein